jgi:DNA polymerase-3 subunit beta
MSTEGLDLVAVTQDVGQAHESLDAKYEGSELTVAFNPDYLLQGIEVLPGDEVTIETVDSLKPALVKSPEHADFLYLLMPVRVS